MTRPAGGTGREVRGMRRRSMRVGRERGQHHHAPPQCTPSISLNSPDHEPPLRGPSSVRPPVETKREVAAVGERSGEGGEVKGECRRGFQAQVPKKQKGTPVKLQPYGTDTPPVHHSFAICLPYVYHIDHKFIYLSIYLSIYLYRCT